MPTNKRSGFTLIEIMLVVIIIGVLVALVAPNLAGKSEPTRDRLRSLENENRRLKSKFAELALDYTSLRAALVKDVKREC